VNWLGLPRFSWSLTFVGLCVFTLVIVTYYFSFIPATLGIAIAAVGLALQPSKLRIPAPVWACGAFVLWAFIASAFSRYPQIVEVEVVEALKFLVIMFIVVNALQTEGQLRFFLLFFLGCFVLFPVRGTLVGADTTFGRAVWNYIYDNPNELATLCLFPLGISLGFLFSAQAPKLVRWGAGCSAILLLVVIFLTQSRGAVIGLAAGMGPAVLRLGVRWPVRAFSFIGVAVLAVVLVVPPAAWERLSGIAMLTSTSTIGMADKEGSAEERFHILQVGWQIFVDHPVFGVGLGAYPDANAAYSQQLGRKDTHNTYLHLAAEVGLPGLLLWCAMVWSVLGYSYRTRRHALPGQLATQQAWVERGMWAYLVSGIFGSYSKLTFPYLALAVLWCSAALLAHSQSRTENALNTKA